MKKRRLAGLVAGLLAISTIASSCGGKSGKGNNGNYENGVVYVTLSKAGYGTGWIDDVVDDFEKQYDIKVEITEKEGATDDITMLLDQKHDNKNADVVVDDLYFTGLETRKWDTWTEFGKCVLEPLDELDCVKRLNPEIKKWGSKAVRKGEEHLYVLHPNIAPETFIYNKNYLEKIESNGEYTKGVWPTTWQGLLDLCKQLVVNMDGKIDGKKVYPYAMYLDDDFEPFKLFETLFAQGNGGNDYYNYWNFEFYNNSPDAEDKKIFVNDSMAGAMWALDDFLKVDVLDDKNQPKYYKIYNGAAETSGDVEAIKGFLSGDALFCWQGSFFETEASNIINSKVLNKIGDNYRMGVVPAISGNEADRTLNLNWPHECIIIPNFAKNKENAKKLLDFIYREENLINIVKCMNAIPGFEHTYTNEEKAKLTRWGNDFIDTYEKYSNKTDYPNGITFRNSTSDPYRGGMLNSINFNIAGEATFFAFEHCSNPDYNKASKEEYLQLLDDIFENGIKKKWTTEWIKTYYVYEK